MNFLHNSSDLEYKLNKPSKNSISKDILKIIPSNQITITSSIKNSTSNVHHTHISNYENEEIEKDEEEEEINSDEYVSSTNLDVETNTYINDENGKKIAIECDGDDFKSKEEYEADIIEQDVLTRCGWKFIRLRASQFYANKEKTVSELVTRINNILTEEDNFNIVEPVFKLKDFDENVEKREEKDNIEDENKDEEINNIEDKISEITKNINLTNIYINDSDKE